MENELIKKVREKCRIRNTALDSEVSDYIEAAKRDMGISGIVIANGQDKLIEQAIVLYCKAQYADSKDSVRYMEAYEKTCVKLALSGEKNVD